LLNFEDDNDNEMFEDNNNDEEDDDDSIGSLDDINDEDEYKKEKPVIETTTSIVDELIGSAKKGSLSALKKLLSIFRSACIPAADSDSENVSISRYIIPTPEIYEYVMFACLENLHIIFYHHLQLNTILNNNKLTKEQIENIIKNNKWKNIQLLVMSFYKSIMYVMNNLINIINNNTNNEITSYLLKSIEIYLPLLAPLPRLTKSLLKILLQLWSLAPVPQEDTTNIRGYSFILIRYMSIMLPGTITEECFRTIYLTYARTCKSYTEINYTTVTYMAQCINELYQCDIAQAYQSSYLYIRQLALHLRTALLKQTSDTIKNILSWQYLNCLKLFTRIICAMPKQDELGPLIYPLVQIMYGVLQSAASSIYIPLKFHIIACLQQLSAYGEVFVPTSMRLLEILELPELTTGSSLIPSTELASNIQYLIRYSNDSIHKQIIRDQIINEIINLIKSEIEIYRYHVSLPEYTYVIIKRIKLFIKKLKINRWRDLLRALCNNIESYSNIVKKSRSELKVAPIEITGFEPLRTDNSIPPASKRLMKLLSSGKGLHAVSEIIVNQNAIKNNKNGNARVEGFAGMRDSLLNSKQNSKQKNKKSKLDDDSDNDSNDEDDDEENEDEFSDDEDNDDFDNDDYGDDMSIDEDEEDEVPQITHTKKQKKGNNDSAKVTTTNNKVQKVMKNDKNNKKSQKKSNKYEDMEEIDDLRDEVNEFNWSEDEDDN
jgi:nucleolar complex protein 2